MVFTLLLKYVLALRYNESILLIIGHYSVMCYLL